MENIERRVERIKAALGKKKASLVLKQATYLSVFTNEWLRGDIAISEGYFVGIGSYEGDEEIDASHLTIVPGFIDGHLHLESAIVTPDQYAKAVIPHGTTAIVADPHEIANVLGEKGIDYILEATKDLPIDVYLMMPSCVPATLFDEAGATVDHKMIDHYLNEERILGLAEMMNYPGILAGDEEVLQKIIVTTKKNKLVDGHGPGLTGKELAAYVAAGVASDHECTETKEAIEKIHNGQWIMIREGTAGKNLEKLVDLLDDRYYERCLLVTDDKHPGELKKEGHIDHIIRKAIRLGAKPINVYKAASINAANYFRLPYRGAIAPGYQADFVVLEDVETVKIHSVYKKGEKQSDHEQLLEAVSSRLSRKEGQEAINLKEVTNSVHIKPLTYEDLQTKKAAEKVIGLIKGELLTSDEGEAAGIDIDKDILKLCVVERHHETGHVGVCYVKGYQLKAGAVATSVAHDAHNIIVVGTNDEDILFAIDRIATLQGGMVVVKDGEVIEELALPIAGLMCDLEVEEAEERLEAVKKAAYALGASRDIDPFMTLSFASLPVIPSLRLTSKGVVDVQQFALI